MELGPPPETLLPVSRRFQFLEMYQISNCKCATKLHKR